MVSQVWPADVGPLWNDSAWRNWSIIVGWSLVPEDAVLLQHVHREPRGKFHLHRWSSLLLSGGSGLGEFHAVSSSSFQNSRGADSCHFAIGTIRLRVVQRLDSWHFFMTKFHDQSSVTWALSESDSAMRHGYTSWICGAQVLDDKNRGFSIVEFAAGERHSFFIFIFHGIVHTIIHCICHTIFHRHAWARSRSDRQ